jgi:CRP/FNR family transcriptional regulator
MDKLSLLKSVFVFTGLDDGLLLQIEKQLKPADVPKGSEIFLEQDVADSFYIVDAGEILITKRLGPDQEKVLSVLGPGSIFGEMAFFSDSPRTANAIAKTDARLWRIDRAGFMAFITREPAAGLRILSGLLQVAMDRLEQTGRELATVYQTAKIISQSQRLADVVARIREELLLAIPEADNIATFLYNEYNMEFTPVTAQPGMEEVAVNDPLLARMKERLCGIVYNNADEPEFPKAGFLTDARSALLVPITKDENLLGFIALWSTKSKGMFKNSHSLLVASVAGQLAEAAENIRHRQEERDRQRLNNARQNYQHPK